MRRIRASYNYGIRSCVYPTIAWRYEGVADRLCITVALQAYALNEMANVERLRTAEQQITSTVDEVMNEFKQRIQSVLSNNQLLPSEPTTSGRMHETRCSVLSAQVPHTMAASTLVKDGQQMTSEAFFDEMNVGESSFPSISDSHSFPSAETIFHRRSFV